VKFLLDTNACVAIINGRPEEVRTRFAKAIRARDEISVSVVSTFELWYGVAKSAQQEANAATLAKFLNGPIELLPFEDEDARVAGAVRGTLQSKGTPIGAYDLLIAGQALHRSLTLVTANSREFRRVPSLRWENWASL
jgi:tRNA(fMet)-specific endonuclease VapC